MSNNKKTIKIELSECSTQNPGESRRKNKKRVVNELKKSDNPIKKDDKNK
jgi:hypothetical protein